MFRFVTVVTLAALGSASYELSHESADEGIIGGQNTTIENHPYLLGLEVYNQFSCGASLISSNVALTAAHCTAELPISSLKVRAGSTYRQHGGILANVLNKCEHPYYVGPQTSYDYDVSVLLLDRHLPLSDSIQTISLQPVGVEIPEGAPAIVAGWGDLNDIETSPSMLQMVVLPKYNQQFCATAYSQLTERMDCYGFTQGGKSVCSGDSGGAIIVNGIQTGIASFVSPYGCAAAGYPSVFAKVSNIGIASHIQQCMASF